MVIGLLAGFGLYMDTKTFLDTAVEAGCLVLSAWREESYDSDGDRTVSFHATILYEVDGVERREDISTPYLWSEGERMTILYSSRNPSDVRATVSPLWVPIAIGVFFVCGGGALFAVGIRTGRRQLDEIWRRYGREGEDRVDR
jgi:hypothetical protein